MTFQQMYENEKMKTNGARPLEWLQGVAVAAIVSVETVYQWGVGCRTPQRAAAKMAADYLGTDPETLFPNLKKTQQ